MNCPAKGGKELCLEVRALSFTYHSWKEAKNTPVLTGVDLCLEQGSRTLLLAPFDRGKSTLARIISGLCPKYLPGVLEGSVHVCGKDLAHTEPWQLLLDCGYVSQNPQEQFVALSVEDEVAFPLESLGLGREEIARRVDTALTNWGLQDLRSSSQQELSGGERKRVLLALQQAVNPRLWVLDESFDDLDRSWREYLTTLIREGEGTTLVLASRYLEQFEDLFDRYALLEGGKVRFGAKAEILHLFSVLCGDGLANPLKGQKLSKNVEHTLVCSDLVTVRTRVSTLEARPFRLSVPHFTITSGDLITLVGPNGSGKSTFSRLLCGLDEPRGGSFTLDGKKMGARDLNRSVGYLFQNPDLQIFLPTVREELSWSLKRRKDLSPDQVTAMVGECAALFGLDLEETPSTMSYPLRKALQAAVYYLLDRPFYILDELDNALTYSVALSIIALLRRNGAGILLITHDRTFASLVGESTYAIEAGVLESI
ncbi:MAG: ATP-binding cassette domain-containing protein [Sphaerochaeta sp.]|nr:ATP-binding cassette domain-containing protein [Sphaerochaeta sp.]